MHAYPRKKPDAHAVKQNSLTLIVTKSIYPNERTRSSRCTALTGLRFVPSVTVFSKLNDRIVLKWWRTHSSSLF